MAMANLNQRSFKRSHLLRLALDDSAGVIFKSEIQKQNEAQEQISSQNPNYVRPNPVHLPRFLFFLPSKPHVDAIEFCCLRYSQTPLQILIKSIVIRVYCQLTGSAWPSMDVFPQIHKNLHTSVNGVLSILQAQQWDKMFNLLALTMPDECVSDYAVEASIDAETESFATLTGTMKLDTEYLRAVLHLPGPVANSQYRSWQPCTKYFLEFVSTNSAMKPEDTLKLESIDDNEELFQILITKPENKVFLPLIMCLGLLLGCPYAGAFSTKRWIMHKDSLFLIAGAFGLLEIDVADLLYVALKTDVKRLKERKTLFCKAIWRTLFASKPPHKNMIQSPVGRSNCTLVNIERFAEIIEHTVGITLQHERDIQIHYERILNTYEHRSANPSAAIISAVLMFEQNRSVAGRYKPKLLQVHER